MPEIGFMKRMFINKAINIKTFALGGQLNPSHLLCIMLILNYVILVNLFSI